MAKVNSLIVTQFNGVDRRSQANVRSVSSNLDTPKELINFHVDSNGHLFLPRADGTLIHDFGVDGPIVRMTWCRVGVVIQAATGVYLLEYGTVGGDDAQFPNPPVLLQTLNTQMVPIWVNSVDLNIYFGYATRGALTGAGATYKAEPDGTGGWTVTDISTSDPLGGEVSMSVMFKGRRFIAGVGRAIHYSDLNAPEIFGTDSNFDIGGDDGATSFDEYIGTIQGMYTWEDVLVFFMRSTVWLLTGSSPETWNLRQVQTVYGSSGPWTLARMEQGLMRYYQLKGDPGIFLFQGSGSQKVSDQVDEFFEGFSPNLVPKGNPYSWQATSWSERYYLAVSSDTAADLQIFCFDAGTGQWTTFDGFTKGAICNDQNGLFFSIGDVVYRAEKSELLPRAPGRNGKIILGYYDQDNPYGMVRFLGVKVQARYEATGAGTASITCKATVPDGPSVSDTKEIDPDSYDSMVFPIQLRDHAIELSFTVAADDDVSVLIESIELVISRKGEKLTLGDTAVVA